MCWGFVAYEQYGEIVSQYLKLVKLSKPFNMCILSVFTNIESIEVLPMEKNMKRYEYDRHYNIL